MGYAEKRGDYWRGRYKLSPGKYDTVKDETGATVRYRTKREAEQAANDAEAKVRAGTHRDPTAGRIRFGDYVNRWYAAQDLALSTMANYRWCIECHLLPAFGEGAAASDSRGRTRGRADTGQPGGSSSRARQAGWSFSASGSGEDGAHGTRHRPHCRARCPAVRSR